MNYRRQRYFSIVWFKSFSQYILFEGRKKNNKRWKPSLLSGRKKRWKITLECLCSNNWHEIILHSRSNLTRTQEVCPREPSLSTILHSVAESAQSIESPQSLPQTQGEKESLSYYLRKPRRGAEWSKNWTCASLVFCFFAPPFIKVLPLLCVVWYQLYHSAARGWESIKAAEVKAHPCPRDSTIICGTISTIIQWACSKHSFIWCLLLRRCCG